MLEFSYQLQVFYDFYREAGMSDRTLLEWVRDVDVLVAIPPSPSTPPSPLIWVEKEKSVGKLLPTEAAI